jgi:hypothetical protein
MLVSRVIALSVLLSRRRSGSLQSRNGAFDAELVVDGVAVYDGLLGLGDTSDDGISRYRSSDGLLMDA